MGLIRKLLSAVAGLVPEALMIAGAACVVWAAWGTDPQLGQLAAGLMLLYSSRQLSRTEKTGRENG